MSSDSFSENHQVGCAGEVMAGGAWQDAQEKRKVT